MILKNYKLTNCKMMYYLWLDDKTIGFKSLSLYYMEQHIKRRYETSI